MWDLARMHDPEKDYVFDYRDVALVPLNDLEKGVKYRGFDPSLDQLHEARYNQLP